MKTSDLDKEWLTHPSFPDVVIISDNHSFETGSKVIADRIVSDHNQMLTANEEILNLTLEALNRIAELKGEINVKVEDVHIFEAFIRIELPKYLAKINGDIDR